jgi:hypothetical protein
MFWSDKKQRARRVETLDVARRLVATWAPDELAVLDVVEDPFVADRPVLADGADGQEFGPEFFSAVSIALTFLVVTARVQGVRLRPALPVDPELAPTVERIVSQALGLPVPTGPGPLCGPRTSVWERRMGALLAQHFTQWHEWMDLCSLASLKQPLSEQETPEAFWTETLATLRARGACDELRALFQLAWERHPDVFELGSVMGSIGSLCGGDSPKAA